MPGFSSYDRSIILGARRELRPQRPRFVEGVVSGPGGTITDLGEPGRIRLTFPASGHSLPEDGVWIAYPLRYIDGRPFPKSPPLVIGTESRYGQLPYGWAQAKVIGTPPTGGNGVRAGVWVVAAPTPADAASTAAVGHGAMLDFLTPDRRVRAYLFRSSSVFSNESPTVAGVDKVRVQGGFVESAVTLLSRASDDRAFEGRFVGNEQIIDGDNEEQPYWLVAGGYRIGASAGVETVDLSIAASIIDNGGDV